MIILSIDDVVGGIDKLSIYDVRLHAISSPSYIYNGNMHDLTAEPGDHHDRLALFFFLKQKQYAIVMV